MSNARFIPCTILIVVDDMVEPINLSSSSCKLAEVLHNQILLKFAVLILLLKFRAGVLIKPQ